MKKEFALFADRVRVDLDGSFTEANIEHIRSVPLYKASSLEGVLANIKKRGEGEIIEQNGNSIVFDTKDLTVYGVIEETENE